VRRSRACGVLGEKLRELLAMAVDTLILANQSMQLGSSPLNGARSASRTIGVQ